MINNDFDEPKENNEDRKVGSHLENGYLSKGDWWAWLPSSDNCPTQSTFPAKSSPYWQTGDIPQKIQEEYSDGELDDPSVQGWKLHLAVDKRDIEKLFTVASPVLKSVGVMHKFSSVESYKEYGDDGKACTIYPVDPTQLDKIVRQLDTAIGIYNTAAKMTCKETAYTTHKEEEQKKFRWVINNSKNKNVHEIRPHNGGVKGDFALGKTGIISCRYGAFTGGLAEAEKLYNPLTDKVCDETRGLVPYPDFIETVPDEIARHIAPISRWRPIISTHRRTDGGGIGPVYKKKKGGTSTGSWVAARHR